MIPRRVASLESASARRPALFWALLGLIFAVGLAIRLYDLPDPPLDFHPTRQLHSAVIARGMYYEHRLDAPEWQRQMAVSQWRAEGLIEPQVFERLAAWTYPLTGGPDLRVPRLYAIFFWLVAAAFTTLLALERIGWSGALAAALVFLAWPYGVIASRAFQPEPLMMALLCAGWWAAARWQSVTLQAQEDGVGEAGPAGRRGWVWAITAGLLCGLAIYIKAVAVFFVAPFLAVIVLSTSRPRFVWRSRPVWVMGVLAVLPYALYHIDGVYGSGRLVEQFSLRFFPQMWSDPAFYLRWVSNLGRVFPFEMLLLAVLGAFLLERPADRLLLLAVWAGYLVYGFTLSHHISTHDYYHLPLFPVVALGLAALAQLAFDHLRGPRWLARSVMAAALLALLLFQTYTAYKTLKRADYTAEVRMWQEIGQRLGPGASLAALVPDYGGGLRYWGWLHPTVWLSAGEMAWRQGLGQSVDVDQQFETLAAERSFFLITDFEELQAQPELRDLLAARYPVYHQAPEYLIYDLRAP